MRDSFCFSLMACVEQCVHSMFGSFRGIDMSIAPSGFLKQKMIEHGFSAKKICHIPNFIFDDDYHASREFDDYIVYFGRLVKEKGVETLIAAVKNLAPLKLIIAGHGSQMQTLERMVDAAGIDNVEFKGCLSREEIKPIIANALFVVLPSQWYEVFGMTIIESFAMGKPVIGANIGGIPEIIDDGINGLLFNPGDAEDLVKKIKYLLNNKDKVREMGGNARKKAEENYGAEAHYEALMKLYTNLVVKR